MRRGRVVLLVAVVLALSSCTGGDEPTTTSTTMPSSIGADSPELAVSELFRLLGRGDPAALLDLTAPDQMVVVALVEGVSVDDAAMLESAGVETVAANFWAGFRSSLLEVLDDDVIEIRIGDVERFAVEGVDFARVQVLFPLDGSGRQFYVIDHGGRWTVDVIATFAPALVPKLPGVADAVRRDPQSGDLLAILREVDPSLQAVQTYDKLDPAVNQAIIAALEAIRR